MGSAGNALWVALFRQDAVEESYLSCTGHCPWGDFSTKGSGVPYEHVANPPVKTPLPIVGSWQPRVWWVDSVILTVCHAGECKYHWHVAWRWISVSDTQCQPNPSTHNEAMNYSAGRTSGCPIQRRAHTGGVGGTVDTGRELYRSASVNKPA